MATLNEVKQRISGVQNTQKITKAMKIVAATKLKKHERIRKTSDPFSQSLDTLVRTLIQHTYHARHPLLEEQHHVAQGGIIIIGSDRGLCGSFNGNLFRKTLEFMAEQQQCERLLVVPLGKRTYDFFKKTPYTIMFHETDIEKKDLRTFADSLADRLVKAYMDGTVHRWCVVSNRFVNKATFDFSHDVIMPLTIEREAHLEDSLYLYENDPSAVLNYLLPRYISDLLYKLIIESKTAEEFARMMAMDSATENANELLSELTLFYNRTRQQVITKEISEIVAGAEALK